MDLMTPVELSMLIAGYVLALNRLLNVIKPLANMGPVWFQVGFPAILAALPQLYNSLLEQQIDQVGIVQAIGTAVVAVFISIRGGGGGTGTGGGEKRDPEGSTVHKGPPNMVAIVALCCCVVSCAAVKPVARTVNDLASDACSIFFGEKQGISLEEAAKTFCNTKEKIDPFLDEILKAQQLAGRKAMAAQGTE